MGAELISVCGATGRQGGAVARTLVRDGRRVRALTRRADRGPARDLAAAGAEVVQADMDDPASLRAAFDGADGVFSVQNGIASGFDREVQQGRNVADAAQAAGVAHLVYGSAGTGKVDNTVPSWQSKLAIEEHIRSLGLPVTVLRPTAFMELMTDKTFYPQVGTWRLFPKLTGEDRAIPWLAVNDLGAIAARAFAEPDRFVGKELKLAADWQTLAQCRSMYREVLGKDPKTVPMPIWLFDKFTRSDPTAQWRWLRTNMVETDVEGTRAVLPSALTVRQWLEKVRDRTAGAGPGRG
ncbi:MAG TPA: NmrA/HSCARG family protein [Actinomycetota bacterium]|nr:NmrA/HSCARG family protein [Actinomycetota bacterium]